MLRQVVKFSVVLAASAVAVPYTVAFIANMLHGWPIGKNKLRRAFHPIKVYSLSYAFLLRQIVNLQYARMYVRWKMFYAKAESSRIVKDICFSDGKPCLDLYLPHTDGGSLVLDRNLPVVVFIYGGTWATGDKSMYPLLCTQLADALKAVVCCPNYSTYPQGYVDDMVQDIVDCLKWIQQNIHIYGADSDRIMLIGHSSGGHLISLVTLELAMKQLMENPDSMVNDEEDDSVTPSMSVSRQISGIHFDEVYFNDNGLPKEDTLALSQGAASGDGLLLSSGAANTLGSSGSSFLFVSKPDQNNKDRLQNSDNSSSVLIVDKNDVAKIIENADQEQSKSDSDTDNGAPLKFQIEKSVTEESKDEEGVDSGDSSDEDDRVTVEEVLVEDKQDKDVDIIDKLNMNINANLMNFAPVESETLGVTSAFELARQTQSSANTVTNDTNEDLLSQSQIEAKSLLSAIKVVVGLAGVYDIGEHYQFEYKRGVEDVSAMARAMYGHQHFDRLSPTVIVQSLPKNTRLPAFHLLHGGTDYVVPIESSDKFAAALYHMGARQVHMTEIPECSHYDIVMDLMDPKRKFYSSVMFQILSSAQKFLT